jgi:hypothetical protein
MKYIFNLLLLLLLTMFTLIIVSCNKEKEMFLTESEIIIEKSTITSKNGVLIFSNQQELGETIEKINKMSREEIEFWQAKYNFRSQLSMFNEIVLAELQLDKPFEGLTDEELSNVTPPPLHSDVYYSYLQKGIIKEFTDEDGEKFYDYNTCAPYLASVLNKDAVVIVADTMYQFTEVSIKKWEGTDISNISAMLTSSNDDIQIYTIPKRDDMLKGAISPNPKYSSWAYSGSKRRIKIGLYFYPWASNSGNTVWSYQHYVHARSEKKNFWGNWRLNWTDMYILGNWSGNLKYEQIGGSTAYHYFNANFHNYPTAYHVYANNFYSSMSIETGTIYPHPATMSISYSQIYPQLNKIIDVSLTDFYWRVTGHNNAIATLYD